MLKPKIYLGTIALEMNRWSTRVPSYLVSDWIPKIESAGFDGLELWENHVLLSPGEAEKIKATGFPVAIYNHYGGFSNSAEDIEKRNVAAEMINRIGAGAVKYNIGSDPFQLTNYKENVLRFADALPKDCVLLCECHDGTALETSHAIKRFFKDLCPQKFGLILHPFECTKALKIKFTRFSERIAHIHSQLTGPGGTRICLDEWPKRVGDCLDVLKSRNFAGNFTIEFTGLTSAPGENIDDLFANAIKDMNFIRDYLSK